MQRNVDSFLNWIRHIFDQGSFNKSCYSIIIEGFSPFLAKKKLTLISLKLQESQSKTLLPRKVFYIATSNEITAICIFTSHSKSCTTNHQSVMVKPKPTFSILHCTLQNVTIQTVPAECGLSQHYESPGLPGTVCALKFMSKNSLIQVLIMFFRVIRKKSIILYFSFDYKF